MGSTSVPMAPLSPSVRKALPKAIADLTVHNVVLGDIQFKTWYPSFYPEELVGRNLQRLYVCQWCFKYSEEVTTFLAHEVESSFQPNPVDNISLVNSLVLSPETVSVPPSYDRDPHLRKGLLRYLRS